MIIFALLINVYLKKFFGNQREGGKTERKLINLSSNLFNSLYIWPYPHEFNFRNS